MYENNKPQYLEFRLDFYCKKVRKKMGLDKIFKNLFCMNAFKNLQSLSICTVLSSESHSSMS